MNVKLRVLYECNRCDYTIDICGANDINMYMELCMKQMRGYRGDCGAA